MKKSMLFMAAMVALVLIIAQLALAQQDTLPAQPANTTQQDTGGNQPAGDGQSQAADPSGQNDASQTQPAAGTEGTLPNLMHLNQNNELVIDCPAVSDRLAQLQTTPANDPQSQAALVGDEELSQLCADNGFKPSNDGGASNGSSPNGTGSTQPQLSQPTTTPSGG